MQAKTLFITGASRGIGRAIALAFAREGANIIIAAKSDKAHPKLAGTIHTVAEEVEVAGGKALPVKLDVRNEQDIKSAVEAGVEKFGGIDVCVNNASAIYLKNTEDTPIRKYDLMQQVNVRATFAVSQACIPHLKKSSNAHILNLSPPLNMQAKWFKDHVAYTISKYGMSLCTLGMAEEFKSSGIHVNSLWPKTTIATDAIRVHFPDAIYKASRKPKIVADAALIVVNKLRETGQFYIDEAVLRDNGVSDFAPYAIDSTIPSFQDLFLD